MDPQAAYASRVLGINLLCWTDSSFPMPVSTVISPTDLVQLRANVFNGLGCRYSLEIAPNDSLSPGFCNRLVYHKIN